MIQRLIGTVCISLVVSHHVNLNWMELGLLFVGLMNLTVD
jgi:hypothetical protein